MTGLLITGLRLYYTHSNQPYTSPAATGQSKQAACDRAEAYHAMRQGSLDELNADDALCME
jgi:hypothetical protein